MSSAAPLPARFARSRQTDLDPTPAKRASRRNRKDEYRCDVAAQAVMRGNQDITVTAVSRAASGSGIAHIAVRVGRVLVYVEDRDALNAFRDAWGRATELADRAFGPLWVTEASEAAMRIRRDGGTPIC